jgi:hypothetical protein
MPNLKSPWSRHSSVVPEMFLFHSSSTFVLLDTLCKPILCSVLGFIITQPISNRYYRKPRQAFPIIVHMCIVVAA